MSTEIVPFDFNGAEIRTLLIDGEPWWVAADVAQALGYSATEAMTRSLDSDEKGMRTLHTPGGAQTRTLISESGLYSAILRSTIPQAKAFKRWVTREVLPAIRKTGSYVAPAAPVGMNLDTIRQLNAAVGTLLEHNERMAVEVTALTPRAEAWDELASAQGDYDVAEAAKILARAGVETGPQRLFDQLHDLGWTFRAPGTGKWEPYASQVSLGYLTAKPQSHFHPRTGVRLLDPPQVRVTLKGIERLRIRLTTNLKAVNQ